MGEIQKIKKARAEVGDDDYPSPGATTDAGHSDSKNFEIGANGLYSTPSKTKSSKKLTGTPDGEPILLFCPVCDEMHDASGW